MYTHGLCLCSISLEFNIVCVNLGVPTLIIAFHYLGNKRRWSLHSVIPLYHYFMFVCESVLLYSRGWFLKHFLVRIMPKIPPVMLVWIICKEKGWNVLFAEMLLWARPTLGVVTVGLVHQSPSSGRRLLIVILFLFTYVGLPRVPGSRPAATHDENSLSKILLFPRVSTEIRTKKSQRRKLRLRNIVWLFHVEIRGHGSK